jgi:C4-dicarboxylate transporter, DctQ subunit
VLGLVAVGVTAGLLMVEGFGTVQFSHKVGLRSNGALAVPMWLPQMLVPIGALLLLLAAIAELFVAWRRKTTPGERVPRAQGIE